jgi:putative heme transporter
MAKGAQTEDQRKLRLATSIAVRVVIVVLVAGLLAWWLYLVREVVVLGFMALVIAAAIHGPVATLERRGLPRAGAVLAVYLGLIGIVAVLLGVIVPPLLDQARALTTNLPGLLDELSGRLNAILAQFGLSTEGNLVDVILGQLGSLGGILGRVPGVIVGFLAALVLITFLSALMVLDRERARDWVMRFVAPHDRALLDGLLHKAGGRLGAYVRGQLLIMLVTGVGSWVGLTLIGVPFALPLGIFAFLTEAIPLAGPVIAGIAMIVVAFIESPVQALLTLGLVIIIQQAESLVLVPVIQGRLIKISPVVALLAVLAGSAVGDIPGAILAIPLVAIAMVVINDLILPWRRAQLGEDAPPIPAPAPVSEAAEAPRA